MNKIGRVKISFERLLKVWVSKLDFDEEELVANDLAWFNQVFGDFFKGDNLNEFINRDGRYEQSSTLPDIDFSEMLETSIDYSIRKPGRWERLKVEEPDLFEYYKQLDDSYLYFDAKHNLIDIYFRIFKKLYFFSGEKDLIRTKRLILSSVVSITQKISIFEASNFNSRALLSDFYYVVLRNLLTEKEVVESKPDLDFISNSLFNSTFFVYYLPLFNYEKVPIAYRYLLNIWIHLNGLKNDDLLDRFLNSLSDMTLSTSSFREIDLYEIRGLLKSEDSKSEFYTSLVNVKSKENQIILLKDLEEYLNLIENASKNKAPDYLPKNIPEYFLKTQRDEAIRLYKFRSMQLLVLEYLCLVLNFKKEEGFLKSFQRLRKNEEWSNHLRFFPQSMDDVLVWLILFKELDFQMTRGFEKSFGHNFLNYIMGFLFKDFVFEETSLKHSLGLMGLTFDTSFLSSLRSLSHDIFEKAEGNILITESEREMSVLFWSSLVAWFSRQIQESEFLTPIEPEVFENLKTNISNHYLENSLVHYLYKNLLPFERKESFQKEYRTFVVASDLQFRKYIIPDWYSAAYGLSESIGRYLYENENIQLDYNFFNKQISLQSRELKREEVQSIVEKYKKESLFVFRNAFPDFFLKAYKSKADKSDLPSSIIFRYHSLDRNPELIIIPKSSMSIQYLYDGRLRNLQLLENNLMWELLDLGGGNEENLRKVKSIKGFTDRFNLSDEELKKHFWFRIAAKAKVVVKDKSSILRFKLNPYGE